MAAGKLLRRESNEKAGGSRRYHVVSRLGHAIAEAVIADDAISNPGHTGFSLRESDLQQGVRVAEVATFLEGEDEFQHLSRAKSIPPKTKSRIRGANGIFTHDCPANFGIPYKRVKEPLYVDLDTVYRWFFTDGPHSLRWEGAPSRRQPEVILEAMRLPWGPIKTISFISIQRQSIHCIGLHVFRETSPPCALSPLLRRWTASGDGNDSRASRAGRVSRECGGNSQQRTDIHQNALARSVEFRQFEAPLLADEDNILEVYASFATLVGNLHSGP